MNEEKKSVIPKWTYFNRVIGEQIYEYHFRSSAAVLVS